LPWLNFSKRLTYKSRDVQDAVPIEQSPASNAQPEGWKPAEEIGKTGRDYIEPTINNAIVIKG
jgi:hypothetical protein